MAAALTVPRSVHGLSAMRVKRVSLAPVRPTVVCRAAEIEIAVTAPVAGKVHVFNAGPQWDQLLKVSEEKLVVVDVFTQWCGPCKMIAPQLEEMAAEFGDKMVMSKIDCTSVPDNKKWAMAEGVKALPTFLFFRGGKRVADMSGAKPEKLKTLIESHM